MRKGSSIVEVVIAIAILSVPIAILLTVIASERPIVDYTSEQMLLSSLASSKMSEIEQAVRLNPQYYATNKYYGFPYSPGSAGDLNTAPWTASTAEGTFFKIGYPEYRYQFYLSNVAGSDVKAISLIVWRRPTHSQAPILKQIMYLEVYVGSKPY